MDVAILGATGSCGRQVAAQLIARAILPMSSRVHLVGHENGAHRTELWGLRADLADAFSDHAPKIEVTTDVAGTKADLVVMMAGATLTKGATDRVALAETNRQIFAEAAEGVSRMSNPVTVLVQSNPLELAVSMFAQFIDRSRVIGAGAWSDSLRFRRELGRDLGLARPKVSAEMWGQHGDHLVPIWSQVQARGVTDQKFLDVIGAARSGRSLKDLPEEIRAAKSETLRLIDQNDVVGAYSFIERQPADIRAAVKPFFTHFTAGHTTEIATAHAVVDLIEFITRGEQMVVPAQVVLSGEMGALSGPLGVPIRLNQKGWSTVVETEVAPDEKEALVQASAAIKASLA